MNRRSYVERNVAVGRRRKIALVAALAVLIAIVACVVASFVFAKASTRASCSTILSLKSALVADSGEGKATIRCSAPILMMEKMAHRPIRLSLCAPTLKRIPPMRFRFPRTPRVSTDGSSRTSLGEIRASEGSAGLVSAVNSLLGIKLSHYATIDAQNFAQLVDELGGIDVNLPEDIVDAQAGDMRLSAGEQTLGGEQAVFACRADDYAVNAEETRGKVQAPRGSGPYAEGDLGRGWVWLYAHGRTCEPRANRHGRKGNRSIPRGHSLHFGREYAGCCFAYVFCAVER